jgi:hypothetical protein
MCVCVCVYVCVCIYIYMCVHVHVRLLTCIAPWIAEEVTAVVLSFLLPRVLQEALNPKP